MTEQNSNRFKGRRLVRRRSLLKGAVASAGALAGGLPLVNIAGAASTTLKIGVIHSATGVRSQFAEADPWMFETIHALTKDGLKIGSRTYAVDVLVRDNQSSLNGTVPVANDLLVRQAVDLLLMPDNDACIGAGELCDAVGTPGISTMTPWQAYFFTRGGDPAKGFPFTFHFFWGADVLIQNYVGMWNSLKTNKTVGTLYFDNTAGKAFADPKHGMPAGMAAAGFHEVDAGFFKPETEDFSNQIASFKNAGVEIQSGFMFSSNWQIFWSQAVQNGYKPECCTVAGPFLFPSGIDVLGDRGDGMSSEVWWTPSFPFHSSLTGQSAKELADAYESASGRQWTQPIGYVHAMWEVAFAALKAAGEPRDRQAVAHALAGMELESVVGKIDFKSGPVRNIAVTPLVGGQWRRRHGAKHASELLVVYNGTAPMIPVQAELQLLSKLA